MTATAEEMAQPWFERWPELLEWELGRFGDLGLSVQVDEDARAFGQLRIQSEVSFRGQSIAVTAAYPSEYPELPPTLFGDPGLLERHQHRFGGNFCLLPRPLDDWPAAGWGAADLIAERLQSLLDDSVAGPDQIRANEAPMPEPVSSYYEYARDAAVLFPIEALPDSLVERGRLRVRLATSNIFVVEASGRGTTAPALLELLPRGENLDVEWKRLDSAPPAGPGGVEIVEWIRSEHPDLISRRPPPPPPKQKGKGRHARQPQKEIVALVFPEEGPGVGETRDAWMFLLIQRLGEERALLVHAEIVSAAERSRRLLELVGLADARVAIVGLGTIGGPIALHLARAGVGRVDLIDCERFEFGNTTRHPLGIEFVGLPKTAALATACRRANPLCEAVGHDIRLGQPAWDESAAPLTLLAEIADEADLVVEATGSHQIAQLLGRLCREAEKPLVSAWMTDGFYAGEVARIIPGKTRCWTCFATDQRQGKVLRPENGPPSDVVVQGCSHPTTVGAGFDADEIAAVAARLAVQTLGPEGGYPDCGWDHATVNFRRAPDDNQFQRFSVESLERHEGCHRCTSGAGALGAR